MQLAAREIVRLLQLRDSVEHVRETDAADPDIRAERIGACAAAST
jgi:hypothetical protein